MSSRSSPEFDSWVARAKEIDVLEVAKELGAQVKRAGATEWVGPCPRCGGTDRFAVNTRQQVYLCRGSGDNNGKDGGDVIALVQHVQSCKFVEAVEFINKEPPPGREDGPAKPFDDSDKRERREEQRDRQIETMTREQQEFEEKCRTSEIIWKSGVPIPDTLAWRYLERRGLRPAEYMIENLRFVPDLPFWGVAEKGSQKLECLGDFPAMIAAIRDVNMRLIGCHRIWIDAETGGKLKPPGHGNAAKKAWGNVEGGCIWLGPVSSFVAMGEGIETALAYWQLGFSGDCTVAAAVSLGNLAGAAEASFPHPTIQKRTVPNGIPDMARPGVVLPKEVEEILVLGDADSDPCMTTHAVTRAVARFRAEGRKAYASFAAKGQDFNDVLLGQQQGEGGAS